MRPKENKNFKKRLDSLINHYYTDILIIFLIVVSIAIIIFESLWVLDRFWKNFFYWLDWGIVGIFIIELSIRFYVYPKKKIFFKHYWLDIIAVLPFFRAFRILRVLRLLRIFRIGILLNRRLSKLSNFIYQAYGEYLTICIVMLVIVLGGTLSMFLLEGGKTSSDPAFKNLSESFWWNLYTLIAGEMGPGQPKTFIGKVITIIVMLAGLSLFAAFTGLVSAAMVHRLKLEDKPMEIETLEHHILICGWNRQAMSVVEQLQSDKTERDRAIVIIAEMEKQPIFDTQIVNTDLVFFIQGDCTNVDVLKRARVEKADKAIILADKSKPRSDQDRDARTVLTALTIEKLNPKIFTCAELLNRDNEVHLRMAGVEEVVVGDEYTANILATVAINQGIVKLLDELFSTKYGNQFIKTIVPESLDGMTFIEMSNFLKNKYDSILVSVEQINNEGKYELHTNPPSNFKIKKGDKLIIITEKTILSLKK